MYSWKTEDGRPIFSGYNGIPLYNFGEIITELWLIVVYLMSSCVDWPFFLTSGPFLNASETSVLKAHECERGANWHTNELNTTFFCSTSPLKAPNRLKSLKLAWRFVLTNCDIYENPFTQEKILKFWQCRTKKSKSSTKFSSVLLFKFFAKEYPTNKRLDTANKILMKNDKSNFLEKISCYEKLPKFE
jgi:hypothetical protein